MGLKKEKPVKDKAVPKNDNAKDAVKAKEPAFQKKVNVVEIEQKEKSCRQKCMKHNCEQLKKTTCK